MSRKVYRDPRERFVEVAEARTNAVLKRIKILGNCSNQQLYHYNPDEINKIFSAIDSELKATKAKFSTGKKREFKLYK